MQLQISDAQARFNLNALAENWVEASVQQQQRGQRYLTGPDRLKPVHATFMRLLQTIALDDDGTVLSEFEAETIMEAVKDWVDVDNAPELATGGAEQNYYDQLDVPYVISNGPMLSVSELLRVRGVTPALYKGLLPHVSALEAGIGINVNTMTLNLARSLNEKGNLQPLSEADGQAIIDELEANPAESLSDFANKPPVSVHSVETDHLDTKTSWFVLEATVTVGDHVRRSRSLINRSSNASKVVRRSDANF
jgi:general secretion pathway protein K